MAKGILIILVIFGHSEISIVGTMLINSFHMAAFFFLSGLTFSCKSNMDVFMKKKVKGLLVPYLVFCGMLLFYQFVKTLIINGVSFDLMSGLISVIVPISGRASTTTYGLWFLPCLFMAEVVGYFFLKKVTMHKALCVTLLIVLCGLCISTYIVSGKASVLSTLPIAVAFLLLGFSFKELMSKIQQWAIIVSIIAGSLFLICVALNWFVCKQTVDLSSMSLGFWPFYLLSNFWGTIAVCAIAMNISKCKFFQGLGRDSLYYYGLHYEVMGIIEKIFKGGILQTVAAFAILVPIVRLYKKMKVIVWEKNK